MNDLIPLAEMIAARLKARRESIAIAESSPGGLISAVLLALPGASAYFLGGAVAYTRPSKIMLLGLDKAALAQFRPATEGHALLLVRGAQARFAANWGPWGNRRYRTDQQPLWRSGGAHLPCGCWSCRAEQTGRAERLDNMHAFAAAGLKLLAETIP